MRGKILSGGSLFAFLAIAGSPVSAQSGAGSTATDGRSGTGIIDTGVPFLLIAPDARSGAMGDVGVALTADANSIHWNPSKLAFMESRSGISISYAPWLQKLVPDISLSYLSGYKRISDRNTIGASLRFFSLGSIQLTDINRNDLGIVSSSEFAVDGTFARKYGDNFSLGTALRFIYSNGQFIIGQDARAGTALAADASAFYRTNAVLFGNDGQITAGINISNIGNKISYVENGRKVFLPTNLRIGGAANIRPDNLNELTFALDINKLLVPSPPVYGVNSGGQLYIVKGRDPSGLSVPAAIFSSFSDAPGGFKEELQEISYSAGMEYTYNKQLVFRTGYFYENPEKGDRQYFTVGGGLKYNLLNLDFAYTIASQENSPLANTLRFSLKYTFKPKAPAVNR